jgi:CII-binding regulator of phage lambda lysogenization HflD
MNIKQALKLKNKLIKSISENTKLLQQYNTIEVGNPRPYSSTVLMVEISKATDELIALKSKIHRANAPMFEKIFEMSELKSTIKALQKLDCTEGKSNRDRYRMESELVLTSEISLVDRNEFIKKLEDRIEQIQDEMDVFNSNTEI